LQGRSFSDEVKLGLDASAGAPCLLSSDCPEQLVCRSGVCTIECLGDKDCPFGTLCDRARLRCLAVAIEAGPDAPGGDAGAGGTGGSGGTAGSAGSAGLPDAGHDVSQDVGKDAPADVAADLSIDTGFVCSYNSDCAEAGAGLVCKSGKCVPECKLDIDCPWGWSCLGGKCVAVAPDGAPDGWGAACNVNSDCTAGLVCAKSGRCAWECSASFDCAPGWCCVQHACVTGAACAAVDAGADSAPDGAADAAQDAPDAKPPCTPCSSNELCDNKLWCDGIEVCYAGCCAPALDTPCNSHSSCVQDSCEEANKTCSHKVLAGEDADKDGHLALLCAGGDDCDDGDNTIYFGAPELCDGKDNDCNAKVDDGTRAPRGLAFAGNSHADFRSGAGAPLGTGWVVFMATLNTLVYEPDHIVAQRIDAAGAIVDATPKVVAPETLGGAQPKIHDAAGESGSALVAHDRPTGPGSNIRGLTLVKPDLTVAKQIVLVPSAVQSSLRADVAWTGSAYLVGWAEYSGSNDYGRIALVQADGTVAWGYKLLPTPDGTGRIDTAVRVASSGSTIAAAYHKAAIQGVTQDLLITILSGGGIVLHGPLTVAPPSWSKLLALAGTSGGYVVAYLDSSGSGKTYARFVGLDGTMPGQPIMLPGTQPLDGDGASDGAGAAFALRDNFGVRFAYARANLEAGLEMSDALKPSYVVPANDRANLAGFLDGPNVRFGVFYFSDKANRLSGIRAGCP
jgi:hypothetical protein